ncbi:MAG: stalk domain-containing protein [Clostridia bacterium]|nr:stalk domain-containing protein [Clostridia bacterium]
MKKFSVKSFISGVVFASALMPVLTLAAGTQQIEAVFGKVQLIINGVKVNAETLLYNGTTYLPIRSVGDSLSAKVEYDPNTYTAKLTLPSQQTTAPNSWGNKTYILATNNSAITAASLVVSNVTSTGFDFSFKTSDNVDIISSTAVITGNSASCKVSDAYSLTFEIHGDEITVRETTGSQLFPDAVATYVHRTVQPTVTDSYVNFKTGKYSSGSSDTAKTLVISNLTSDSFKYQVIAANGKDIVTEGTAKITGSGKAKCEFKDDYVITFTDLKNDVIKLEESSQQLFPAGGIKFYTT